MSSVAEWTSEEARLQFRQNAFHGRSTSGWCLGSLQANVAILPFLLADDFERFCEVNRAPCPLLYRSKRGELSAGPLSDNSDIRTDVPKYCISEHGQVVQEVTDLLKYPWEEMVSFYIGCSFSFEEALVGAGICEQIVKKDCNVPMYKTNIQCHPVGPFACPMVVSMRPIPKDLVEKAIAVTSVYDAVHGAPIHIGDPAVIGINDINTPDYGPNACAIGDDDVPVFWACGVTSSLAVRSAKPLLSFSHSPGFMFICDTSVKEYFKTHPPEYGDVVPRLIPVKEEPFNASVLTDVTMRNIGQLESAIQQQRLGGRDSRSLSNPDDLVKATSRLSHASSVAVTTGFPSLLTNDPVIESNGIPGVIAVAKALQALDKQVFIIACDYQLSLLQRLMKYCCDTGLLSAPVAVFTYTPGSTAEKQTAVQFSFPCGIEERPTFDMLVAIKAGGRNTEGKYFTMRANEVRILEACLMEAHKSRGKMGILGFGDGGNEIVMENVGQQALQHVPDGQKIASCVSADRLIAVSNSGGYALAAALYVLNKCLVHSRFVRRGIGRHQSLELNQFINTVEQEREMLGFMVSHHNIPFDPDYTNMLNKIRQIAAI